MRLIAAVIFAAGAALSGCSPSESVHPGNWDPHAAARYLDSRVQWWMQWPHAARDHGTFCVSCHTVLPYALARPTLHAALGESGPTAPERRVLEDVRERVRHWSESNPFYDDRHFGADKTPQSRGTESVLNALVLTADENGTGQLSADARSALDIMWGQQIAGGADRGAWAWLNFGLRPWESADAGYYGAALAALAVGFTPASYEADPASREHVRRLIDYLDRRYTTQSLEHRVLVLWASLKLPGLLSQDRQQEIATDVLNAQRSDGGWSLSVMARQHWRVFGLLPSVSDGYATGLATLVLEQMPMARARAAAAIGRAWLRQNQLGPQGQWVCTSLNKRRQPSEPAALFMSDAATAYAVLALDAGPLSSRSPTRAPALNSLVR